MKRKYEKPNMRVIKLVHQPMLLDGSPIKTNNQRYNMGYGGIDNDGDLDPE